jgi:superfamily II DNA/RNA helicase
MKYSVFLTIDCWLISAFSTPGRVARAGRGGAAYSLVCTDEIPFVYDLHLFLGRPLQLATPDHQQGTSTGQQHVIHSVREWNHY